MSRRVLTEPRVDTDYVCAGRPYVIGYSDVELGGVSIFARGYANAGKAGTAWATQWATVRTD